MLDHLHLFLSAAVPIQIMALRDRGGPAGYDYGWACETFAHDLATRGDVLQYGGVPGEAGALAGQLAKALAILAYQPGGVRVGDNHWEAQRDPPA